MRFKFHYGGVHHIRGSHQSERLQASLDQKAINCGSESQKGGKESVGTTLKGRKHGGTR